MLEPQIRKKKEITVRLLPESGLEQFGDWLKTESWEKVFNAKTAHDKARNLQNLLMENLDKFLPQKVMKITSEDRPWFNQKLKNMDRRLKREYVKHMQAKKWKFLQTKLKEKCSEEKVNYYTNIVEDLKTSQPSQWYSKLKRMT